MRMPDGSRSRAPSGMLPCMLSVGRWALELAAGWQAELEEGCVCVTAPEGHGALLISHRHRATHPIERAELEGLANAELPGSADVGACRMGDFEGLHASYIEDDRRWHRFYLSFGTLLLLVSYTVELEHDGSEDDAVLGMLRSLRAHGERWE
jgi:hypothetical protein